MLPNPKTLTMSEPSTYTKSVFFTHSRCESTPMTKGNAAGYEIKPLFSKAETIITFLRNNFSQTSLSSFENVIVPKLRLIMSQVRL